MASSRPKYLSSISSLRKNQSVTWVLSFPAYSRVSFFWSRISAPSRFSLSKKSMDMRLMLTSVLRSFESFRVTCLMMRFCPQSVCMSSSAMRISNNRERIMPATILRALFREKIWVKLVLHKQRTSQNSRSQFAVRIVRRRAED